MVEDLPRSGQPSTSSNKVSIAKVKEMATENRHLSSRQIAAKNYYWVIRWHKCIISEGAYFKGDKINLDK